MGNRNCHRTPREKLAIIEYAEKNGMEKACAKYDITERSIWRYKSLYDGTLQSLENKSSKPPTHPNQHTEEEINNIKEVLHKHPYISLEELYSILKEQYGYNRNKFGLYNFLRRNRMIPEPKQKKDYATIFDKRAVTRMNNKYAFNNRDKLPLYIIELNDYGIYLGTENNNNPCNLTVYYSTALKFDNIEDAETFMKTIKNSSQFKPSIKEIQV